MAKLTLNITDAQGMYTGNVDATEQIFGIA